MGDAAFRALPRFVPAGGRGDGPRWQRKVRAHAARPRSSWRVAVLSARVALALELPCVVRLVMASQQELKEY
jgi:hypothetical protein